MKKYENYLHIANRNLEDARIAMNHKRYSATCFYSQQTVELCLKSMLETETYDKENYSLLKSHSLHTMLRKLKEYLPKLTNIENELRKLTDMYFDTRYPGIDFYEPVYEDAREGLEVANRVLQEVVKYYLNKYENSTTDEFQT